MKHQFRFDCAQVRWGVFASLTIILLTACAEKPFHERCVDLVAQRKLRVEGQPLRAHEVFAADETWVSVTLTAGQTMTSQVDLSIKPRLDLVGLLECSDRGAYNEQAVLRGSVKGPAREIAFVFVLDGGAGWQGVEIDLGSLADATAVLEVRAEIAAGCSVHLREVTLRHFVPTPPASPDPPPQIVLISVDTLRLDGVGVFSDSIETPALDRFAAEAESWRHHYAAASWTKPSHATMLTGYFPDTHRALLLDQSIDPQIPTLAERFRAGGFSTGGLVFDCTWLSPRWGFGKGFDDYRVTHWRAGRQARSAADWILEHSDEQFFFFLHTFEPHSDFNLIPYEAPGASRRWIEDQFGVRGFGCRGGLCGSTFVNGLSRGEIDLEPQDGEILRATYDAGIGYLDASLGLLFESLRQHGVWDNLLVIVTSDHGEEFLEHGGFSHGTLHDEVLRVPLLIKWPGGGRAGLIHDGPTSSVDLAPTLLDFAGLAVDTLPGTVLGNRSVETPVFSGTLSRAVVFGKFKAITDQSLAVREVYDLSSDPGENDNLAASRMDLAAELEALVRGNQQTALRLFGQIGSNIQHRGVELSDKERARLRAFGYLENE